MVKSISFINGEGKEFSFYENNLSKSYSLFYHRLTAGSLHKLLLYVQSHPE